MDSKPYTVHIYADEAGLISEWTLEHSNIETGGDIFGLWLTTNEVVIQAVLGPGQNCRRTATSFFQDEQYLSNVGGLLTNNHGLCNVGSWHSHHTMNLPEPSRGDRDTVWRHLPTPGRFLLLIATIDMKTGSPKVLMGFNLFESTNEGKEVIPMNLEILEGKSPIRANEGLSRKMLEGSEVDSKKTRYQKPSVQSSPSKLNERKASRVRKSKAAGPEANAEKYRQPNVRGNQGHDDCKDFFQNKASGSRGHRKSHDQNLTCEIGVRSSSIYDNTFLRTDRRHLRIPKPRHRGKYELSPFTYSVYELPDGREGMTLLHHGHSLGSCGECRTMVVRQKANGELYADETQADCCSCCTIL